MCLISLQFLIPIWDFQFLESERQCSISSFSPGILTKVKTIESKSAGEARRLFALITRLISNSNFLLAQEGAVNTEFLDRQKLTMYKNADI